MNFPKINYKLFCNNVENNVTNYSKLIISPPNFLLSELVGHFQKIEFASQDISHISQDYGAYTGEVSAKMLNQIGAKYSIIGHSERRKYFSETNEIVMKKACLLLKNNLTPIICVGETEEIRNSNNWKEFLVNQITSSVPETSSEIILAYEPVWAIGTGRSANIDQITEVTKLITTTISKLAPKAVLVYGGSVNGDNSGPINTIQDISGILVGSASLDINEFIKIIKNNV